MLRPHKSPHTIDGGDHITVCTLIAPLARPSPMLSEAAPDRAPDTGNGDPSHSLHTPLYQGRYDDDVSTDLYVATAAVQPVVLSWSNVHLRVRKPSGGTLHVLRGVSGVAGGVTRVSGAVGHWRQCVTWGLIETTNTPNRRH